MKQAKDWRDMMAWSADLLRRSTGEDVAAWNERIRQTGIDDEADLRAWLAEQGIIGYAQMLLVMERFGYPDFLTATAEELIDNQYADRPALRPIADRVLLAAADCGDITVQARKTYISLVTPRRTFAQVAATTRTRVDLGLRLEGVEPEGRLLPAKSMSNVPVRVPLRAADEVDDEVRALLQRAYDANA